MSVAEIVKQAQALSPQDRAELIQRLLSMRTAEDSTHEEPDHDASPHWGQSLNRLLDEIGPVALKYPEIDDPVAWVKHLRAEQRKRRFGDWGSSR